MLVCVLIDVQRIQAYLQNILSRWYRRSLPNCRDGFLHWKRHTFSMRVSELPRTCLPPSHQQELCMNTLIDEEYAGSATGKLPMSRDPGMQKRSHIISYRSLVYDRLVASLGATRDPEGCFKLVGRYLDDISRDVAYGYHLTEEVDFRVDQTNKMIDKTKADVNRKVSCQYMKLEIDFAYISLMPRSTDLNLHLTIRSKNSSLISTSHQHHLYRTSSLNLLNTFKKEHGIIQEDNSAKLKDHAEHLQRIDRKIGDILKGMEEQNEKIERLFSLHGSMLNRINHIEEVQEGAVKNIQGIRIINQCILVIFFSVELLTDMTAAKGCIVRTSDDV